MAGKIQGVLLDGTNLGRLVEDLAARFLTENDENVDRATDALVEYVVGENRDDPALRYSARVAVLSVARKRRQC